MVDAARASVLRVAAPPCPIQSLAKHNRKPLQLTENKHQRPRSIASFCRNLLPPPPHPTNDDLPFTYHASWFTDHQLLLTHDAFLIATQILDIELTRSQQTRKHFLIATNFDLSVSVPHRNNPLRIFLTATHPNSEIWQPYETKRETIFLPQHRNASWDRQSCLFSLVLEPRNAKSIAPNQLRTGRIDCLCHWRRASRITNHYSLLTNHQSRLSTRMRLAWVCR
jgi:hypothetical protein